MKKVMWSTGVSLALAIVLVATIGVTTPAPVTAESGARVCGYLLMPLLDPTKPASVIKNLGIMVEVPEGNDSLCKKGMEKILDGIKKDPTAKAYYKGNLKLDSSKPVYDQWVYFELATCEKIGEYFGGSVGSNDICEGGHPQNGMNRLSTSEGTHHSYTWTRAFYQLDAAGKPVGADGKPVSATNPPVKLTTPTLTKVTKSS